MTDCSGEWRTANGPRLPANGERRTPKVLRQTVNGKRQTGLGYLETDSRTWRKIGILQNSMEGNRQRVGGAESIGQSLNPFWHPRAAASIASGPPLSRMPGPDQGRED